MKRRFAALLILVAACGSVVSCAREENLLGRKATRLIPEKYLNGQAATAYEQEKKSHPQSPNAGHQQIVKRVGDRLIDVAERDYPQACLGFEWEVNLFDKADIVNAYCMPGGKIAFYTGILPVCKNEAGVAAVMGHEISHALLKHGNERITRQLGVQAILIGAAIGVGSSDMDRDRQRIILAGLGLGSTVGLILPFSRSHEGEADRLGLFLMAKGGYDPSEAPDLWIRMTQISKGKQPPEFFSTHPSHEKRIARLTELQPEALELYKKAAVKHGKGEDFR
ncbi:MAG: M48 family metallopeptidase [Planctomycetes bacterium]|nr:M48 family metallopeptidase [Planctomycetota bacterium]